MKQSSTSYVHVSSHGNFGTSCSVVLDYQMLHLNQVWQGSLIGGNKLAALSTRTLGEALTRWSYWVLGYFGRKGMT
jgi:hypothetical protein